MRTPILCLLILLLVVCALSLQTEGFATVCLPFPDLTIGNIFFFLLAISIITGGAVFYAWNWNTLRTTTSTHIIGRYLFNSKVSS
jgi:hypothetical protein